jgi:hypothetical protein
MNIEKQIDAEWLEWMKLNYVAVLIDTGLLLEGKILRLLNEEENNPGITYSFQFTLKTLEDLTTLLEVHEQELMSLVYKRYQGKFVEFRTILEVV